MISAEVVTAYRTVCRRAQVTSRNLGGLDIGDDISLDIGYTTDHAVMFSGRIRSISVANPRGTYVIDAEDALWQAKEYYFVPADLDNPWSRSNISAEDLVEDILNEAGLTDYVGYATGFTFATGTQPVEIKLVSAWDYISWICEVVGGHVYADTGGQVHFENLDPVPGVSSATLQTGEGQEIIFSDYQKSDDRARNKVVVFGYGSISAEASAAPNGYTLPANFYKTAIISHAMIDTEAMAQSAADLNLTALNRLTESVRCDIEGDVDIDCRDTVTVTEAFTGVSGDWFIHECRHVIGDTYRTNMMLTK
jgi:hypothetical protein